jgi:hypothetical protein
MAGIQDWLSFYFKSPMSDPAIDPENDLFLQLERMNDTLRSLMNEEGHRSASSSHTEAEAPRLAAEASNR